LHPQKNPPDRPPNQETSLYDSRHAQPTGQSPKRFTERFRQQVSEIAKAGEGFDQTVTYEAYRQGAQNCDKVIVFGVDIYHRDPVDLVITDLNMPVVDGYAVISALRKESPELKIVIVAGIGRTKNSFYTFYKKV
jgi:CheY-like chemotaxis protein